MTSSTTLQIEERTLGDPDLDALVVAAVAELNRRYRVPGEPDDDYPLAQDACCLVAFVDGVPAGCIAREAVSEAGWERVAPRTVKYWNQEPCCPAGFRPAFLNSPAM